MMYTVCLHCCRISFFWFLFELDSSLLGSSVCRTCSIFRWMVLFLNGAFLHTKVTGLLETPTPWDFFDRPEKKDRCYIFGRGFKTEVLHHTVSELHRQLLSRPLDSRQLMTKLRCCREFRVNISQFGNCYNQCFQSSNGNAALKKEDR